MKYILICLTLALFACNQSEKFEIPDDCTWRVGYNGYYNKWCIGREYWIKNPLKLVYEQEFLLKNHFGEYGVYGENWMQCRNDDRCADKEKSLFDSMDEAKEFLQEYLRKQKYDKWIFSK